MGKTLTIQFGDVTLFCGVVERVAYTESDSGGVELKAGPDRFNLVEQLQAQLAKRATEPKPVINGEIER